MTEGCSIKEMLSYRWTIKVEEQVLGLHYVQYLHEQLTAG